MRNCFFCDVRECPDHGIDGNFTDDCPYLPPDPPDEDEERNFREYEEEMANLELEEEQARELEKHILAEGLSSHAKKEI